MLELIVAGVVGIAGHLKSKDFVRRRLRYTNWVDKPGIGLATGAATAIVVAPAIALLPVVGAGAGMAVGIGAGIGVGTGVSRGASQARAGYIEEGDH